MSKKASMTSGTDSRSARVLTGDGRGAITVIHTRGRSALETVDLAFRPFVGRPLKSSPPGSPRFGVFGPDLGEDVVVVRLEGDPPEVEIHCHGGIASTRRACEILKASGFMLVDPRDDPRISAAEDALASATTLRTAQILQDQVDGAWDRESEDIRSLFALGGSQLLPRVDELLVRSTVGLRLITGWRVVMAGRPNVGKSRLMNALAGYDRSVVSPFAGTTRDIVTCRISVDGWPIEIADTAGLRRGSSELESSGIALARERVASSDLVLVVLDRSSPLEGEDLALIDAHPEALVVANKLDLEPAWDIGAIIAQPLSAATGEGLDEFLAAMSRRLVPQVPPVDSAVPFTRSQVEWLRRIRAELTNG
jgi:tRNA modification GTPase